MHSGHLSQLGTFTYLSILFSPLLFHPGYQISLTACLFTWQHIFTATGNPAIWVAYVLIFTASAVVVPPNPPGHYAVILICCCTVVAPVSVIFGAMAFFFSLT